jgi:hypothetical protein
VQSSFIARSFPSQALFTSFAPSPPFSNFERALNARAEDLEAFGLRTAYGANGGRANGIPLVPGVTKIKAATENRENFADGAANPSQHRSRNSAAASRM